MYRVVGALGYLDLLNAVDNEHVLQVLYSSIHPVVEGRRPLGELEVQLVNSLPQLLNTLIETTNPCQCSPKKNDQNKQYFCFLCVMHSGTSSASLLFWVRVPRLSHWSQMPWQRALTVAASW